MGKTYKIIIFCFLLLNPSTYSALAEIGRSTPSMDGIYSAGPYYNPASKSYFELFRMPNVEGERRWEHANARAQRLYYKNTQGRLAIIKNIATHQFISQKFKSGYIWIGLQYYCKSGTLKWVDGSELQPGDFVAWARKWAKIDTIRCANRRSPSSGIMFDYMPVSYTSNTPTKTLRWQATGSFKAYILYLVEYPTGKK